MILYGNVVQYGTVCYCVVLGSTVLCYVVLCASVRAPGRRRAVAVSVADPNTLAIAGGKLISPGKVRTKKSPID